MWAKLRSEQPGRSVSEEGATNPRWTRRLSFNAALRRLSGRDEGEGLALARGCRENRLRRILHHPARNQWAGLREDGQACPCRTADQDGTEARESLTPSQRGYSDLRHDENDVIAGNGGRDGERGRN